MELREMVARELCLIAGHDPDSPTMDIYVPDDPVAHLPWAGYRRDADRILSLEPIKEALELKAAEDSNKADYARWLAAAAVPPTP